MIEDDAHTKGRLRARPARSSTGVPADVAPAGFQPLGVSTARGGYRYAPATHQVGHPAPLVVLLHGAGGDARTTLALLRGPADATGLILLVPTSREYTWDVIAGGYGPDVAAIDGALESTFSLYGVDPGCIAIGGFSDGASYALSLGITNGDLFGHVLAFSPGFMAPTAQIGSPRILVSHGTHDEVLPIERCSRRIVPRLERTGSDVRYREFEGGHSVPPEIRCEATDWFTAEQN